MTARPRNSATLPPAVLARLSALQGSLNAFIDPNWITNRDPDDWGLAITLEAAELIDSYPWKWWKNVKAAPDIANAKVELVDILHFSLSGTMQLLFGRANSGNSNSSSKAAADSSSSSALQEQQLKAWGLSHSISTPLTDVKNCVLTFRNVIGLAKFHKFDLITEHVVASAEDLGFNLVAYYIAKHTLNVIRQLGGYKNGTYVKVNSGKEDNELLHEVIAGVTLEDCTNEDTHEAVWDKIMEGVYVAFQIPEDQRKKTKNWLK